MTANLFVREVFPEGDANVSRIDGHGRAHLAGQLEDADPPAEELDVHLVSVVTGTRDLDPSSGRSA
jgi:hypothetical protein